MKQRLSSLIWRMGPLALGALFVAVAGAVAIQMAYASGADDVRRWTMVAIVSIGLALLLFGPGLTIGRGRYFAAMLLVPVWLAAVSYNGLSALEYFDRYLADAEARARIGSELFRTARDDLQRLRDTRASIKTVRDVATIESDMGRRGIGEQAAEKLRLELDEARARDRIDADIRQAAARLSGADARGEVTTAKRVAPLFVWLSEVTGVAIVSTADLRALFLLLLTEMGAALVPVAMALSAAKPRQAAAGKAPVADQQPSELSGIPPRAELADVTLWINHRTRRASGAMAEASVLYDDYVQWMTARGKAAVSKTRFGGMLTEDCGLAKRKAGARWTINYLGLELKPVASTGGRLSFLTIAGGRAA